MLLDFLDLGHDGFNGDILFDEHINKRGFLVFGKEDPFPKRALQGILRVMWPVRQGLDGIYAGNR